MFNLKSKKPKKAILFLIGLIIIALSFAFIYKMSSQDGYRSNAVSKKIVSFFKEKVEFLDALNQNPYIESINFNVVIRKIAHFTEYFFLFLIIHIVLSLTKLNDRKNKLISFIICVLFAVTDEFHQLFVSGRTSKLTDIIIDSLGAFTAMQLTYVFKKREEKIID